MTARRTRLQQRSEAGQALVLTVAFSAVLAVMVLYLFGTAQLSNQKTKLQNTADAAAYSAGVLQARDYNFSAYTNRAMVANHVAVAQFTGLESWTEEIVKEFRSDGPCIPYITESKCGAAMMATFAPMWDIPNNAARAASNVTRRAFNVEKPLARGLEPLIVALQTAQRAYHMATLAQFAGGAVDAVVKANDPNASVARASFFTTVVATEIVEWNKYTKNMTTQPELKRFANVTVDSAGKDGFTHSRNATPRLTPSLLSFVKPLYCPLAEFTGITMGLTHGGGTQLSTDMTRWTALDAAGVAGAWTCVFYVPPFEVVVIGAPITSLYMDLNAHGGGQAGRNGGFQRTGYATPTTNSRDYGQIGGALENPITLPPATIRYFQGPGSGNNVASNYTGIRKYEDISAYSTLPATQVDPANNAPPLSIEVQKTSANIRTAAQVLPGNNLLKLNDQLKGNVMKTVATSQAYFMRPHRADHQRLLNASYRRDGDNKTEYASLYNPYWQSRLVATPRVNIELSTTTQ